MSSNTIELSTRGMAGELLDLCKRVDRKKPQATDIEELREHLKQIPDLWRVTGDLSAMAIRLMIDQHPDDSRSAKLSAEAGVESVKRDLGYENANQLERLLIEHLVICWLHLGRAQLRYHVVASRESLTLEQGDYWERYLSASQRRFLRACETLARVKKAGVKLQVNIAKQQIIDNRGTL